MLWAGWASLRIVAFLKNLDQILIRFGDPIT